MHQLEVIPINEMHATTDWWMTDIVIVGFVMLQYEVIPISGMHGATDLTVPVPNRELRK